MRNKAATEIKTVSVDPVYSPMAATITGTRQMTAAEKFFEISLDSGKPLGHQPGQFVQLSIFGIGEAPITISSSPSKKDNSTFEACVRKVGAFTNALHRLNTGDKLGVRGPYGKPFPIDEFKGNDLLLIGGGLGIVPLRSLINFIMDTRGGFGKLIILLGYRAPEDMLFLDEIAKWIKMPDVYYDCIVDKAGKKWKGKTGVITDLITEVEINVNRCYAVVVGPPVMYKFVILKLLEKGLPENQMIFSLERRMKCGLGKCGHCQINNVYVCKDGPTFRLTEIKNLEEAL